MRKAFSNARVLLVGFDNHYFFNCFAEAKKKEKQVL